MNEIIKGLGKFLSRDLMYVIGGSSFLLSISFAFGLDFNVIAELTKNTVLTLFMLGVAYVLGYINQEVLCLSPLLTTSKIKNPNRFLQWVYLRFTKSAFKQPNDFEYTSERIKLLKHYKEEELKDFERIVALKHIGSAVGSNWFISSIILLFTCYTKSVSHVGWIFSSYLLFAALALILLAWIKGMQQYVTMNEVINHTKTTEHFNQGDGV